MYKNQLQELAQRSCFNLPSYACMREGPDHAPRFRASVNFNGEIFESPGYSSTLRQAEHSAAEVALNALSTRGSKSLTARVLDETGVYKNLLQETAHKAGLDLPVYTTVRSGPGHVPVFTCTVELAGMDFTGEPAKTKKQAEKNAAIAAWSALKKMPNFVLKKETDNHEEQDKEIVRRVLSNLRPRTENQTARRTVRRFHKDNRNSSASPVKYQSWRHLDYLFNSASSETQAQQQTSSCSSFVDLLPPPPPRTTSKILPLTFSSFPHKRHRNSPAQIATQSQVTMQEIPNYSKREDEERLDGSMKRAGKECTTTWSNTCKPFTMPSTSTSTTQQEHIKNKIFRPFRPPPPLGTASKAAAFRSAPAVQIRSVIPVCSAPSPSMRPLKSNPPPLTLSLYHSSPMSTNTGGARVPPSSTNFNREEPDSTQLSSEFIKLQL